MPLGAIRDRAWRLGPSRHIDRETSPEIAAVAETATEIVTEIAIGTATSTSRLKTPVRSLSEEKCLGLLVLEEGFNPTIDIVAIHGLNGHAMNTWTASNNVLWLRDLLPKDLPQARIFSFGYGAYTHGASCLDRQYLHNHATTLLVDLCRKREVTKTETRPIIFVAHSLGGIVLKSALIRSDAAREGDNERHRSIALSTYGIFFMGTPHRGGNRVSLGQAAIKVASSFIKADNRLLKHLQKDSEYLQHQHEQFSTISRDFVIKFCYETQATPTPLGDIMVVDITSAVVPGTANTEGVAIMANHKDMVRFLSRTDGGYQKISDSLQIMAGNACVSIDARWKSEKRLKQAKSGMFSTSSRVCTYKRLVSDLIPLGNGLLHRVAAPSVSKAPECLDDNKHVEKHFIVPRQNPNFTGREDTIREIDRLIKKQGNGQVRICLYGLGGIGKTAIALDFAWSSKAEYHTFWVHGATIEQFLADYSKVGMEVDVVKADMSATESCQAVKRWLDSKESGDWRMIVDNLDDLSNSLVNDVLKSLPTQRGTVLITSRNENIVGPIVSEGFGIRLREMSLSDAAKTFQKLSGIRNSEVESAAQISLLDQLGYLPLAIAQAAAYIRKQQTTAELYLKQMQVSEKNQVRLLERAISVTDHAERAIQQSVMTTWELSFEYIKRTNESAGSLLQVMSLLDFQSIPKSLLRSKALSEIGLEDDIDFDDAMELLLAFDLVTVVQDDQMSRYQLHRLVSLWTRKSATSIDRIVEIALKSVEEAFPQIDDHKFQEWSHMLPHATAVLSRAERRNEFSESRAALSFKLSAYLYSAGYYDQAEASMVYCYTYFSQQKERAEKTLRCLCKMGLLKVAKGQYLLAISLYDQASEMALELSDENHSSLRNIKMLKASALYYLGRFEDAMEQFKSFLANTEKRGEIDDEITLKVQLSIGNVLVSQGKHDEALKHYQLALNGWKTLGREDEIGVFHTIASIAAVHKYRGEHDTAINFFKQAVTGMEAQLGKDHPRTLETMSNMATCLLTMKQYSEAFELQQKVLQEQGRRLGKTHCLTLNTLHNLGETFKHQGKYEQALQTYSQVLEGRETTVVAGDLPLEYYMTLDSMGDVYAAQMDYNRAVDYYSRASDGAMRILTTEHRIPLAMLERKAGILIRQENYDAALQCLNTVVEGRGKVFGREHSLTVAAREKQTDVVERSKL